ncbi:MAG: hypothetical protein ABRQ27_16070 [Clostridiaceae bacterium]
MKNNIKFILFIILAAIAVIIGTVLYKLPKTPLDPPVPILKYNNIDVALIQGEYNWTSDPLSGSSNLTVNPFKATEDIEPLKVTTNDIIKFKFPSRIKPKKIYIRQCTSLYKSNPYAEYQDVSSGEIVMPSEIGVYVFEISGSWNELHNTSHYFKVIVN